MQTEFIYAGILTLAILIYLIYTLLHPERF